MERKAHIDFKFMGIKPINHTTYLKFAHPIPKDTILNKEKLHRVELTNVIDTYLYDGRKPLTDDIAKTLQVKPKLLERKKVIPRILDEIVSFVEKFYDK